MEWIELKEESQLDKIVEESKTNPVVIFKHSIRCSISAAAHGRIERDWNKEKMKAIKFYYLDIINNRSISNKIAEVLNVPHESPQVFIIEDGKCKYTAAHMSISYKALKELLLAKA